ncbi:MAG: hypothetical protein GY862_25365 [Gammaproteobacteria bacterium]|nr:hypothetical protein [Gammaproteobacteria bacterium]
MPAGRPKIVITDQMIAEVETLAGIGLTIPQICLVIGVSESWLMKRKRAQIKINTALELGRAKAQTVIGQSLFKRAKKGDINAIRWWEMTRANRRATQPVNDQGNTDTVVRHPDVIEFVAGKDDD